MSRKKFNSHYRCDACDGIIEDGEIYFENENGEIVHEDCLKPYELVEWLGGEVKTVDLEDEYISFIEDTNADENY